jgi:hypothetical protein
VIIFVTKNQLIKKIRNSRPLIGRG